MKKNCEQYATSVSTPKSTGRTLAEFRPLLLAEQLLLDCCGDGTAARCADSSSNPAKRPDKPTDRNTIRGSFIRFMLLGGDENTALHENGIQLIGAYVQGELIADYCDIRFRVHIQATTFSSNLQFHSTRFSQNVSLINCGMQGMYAQDSQFDSGYCCDGTAIYSKTQIALDLSRCVVVGQAMFCETPVSRFSVIGRVLLTDARINGSLLFSGASIEGIDDLAFDFSGIKVEATINFSDGIKSPFEINGEAYLAGACIGGQFHCDSAKFQNKEKTALNLNGAVIGGSIFFRIGAHSNFRAEGKISLIGSTIGGSVYFNGASLHAQSGPALSMDRANVKGSIFFTDVSGSRFEANGEVRLSGAYIGGQLGCDGALFQSLNRAALNLQRASVKGSAHLLFYNSPNSKTRSTIDLSFAHFGLLVDSELSWNYCFRLNGFTYDSISASSPKRAQARLKWLEQQPPEDVRPTKEDRDQFCPQPWKQLQKVLNNMGHTEEATQVAIALETRLRKIKLIGQAPTLPAWMRPIYSFAAKTFHGLFGTFTGYGYRPMRLLAWTVFIWLACAAFYWWAALERGVFAPTNPLVFQNLKYLTCKPDRETEWCALQQRGIYAAVVVRGQCNVSLTETLTIPDKFTGLGNWYTCDATPEEYTSFSPLAYSLDIILPLVDLQQEKDWSPLIPTPKNEPWAEIKQHTVKHITRLVMWFEILYGWVASLLFVAILSGKAKRGGE